jgi:hypothetical protein
MQTCLPNKYQLMDLHKEIDLFDRKIAHCQQFEKFEFESGRTAAVQKLQRKRQTLVNLAMSLSRSGIEHDPKFLPRSLALDADGQIMEALDRSTHTAREGVRG